MTTTKQGKVSFHHTSDDADEELRQRMVDQSRNCFVDKLLKKRRVTVRMLRDRDHRPSMIVVLLDNEPFSAQRVAVTTSFEGQVAYVNIELEEIDDDTLMQIMADPSKFDLYMDNTDQTLH